MLNSLKLVAPMIFPRDRLHELFKVLVEGLHGTWVQGQANVVVIHSHVSAFMLSRASKHLVRQGLGHHANTRASRLWRGIRGGHRRVHLVSKPSAR